MRSSHAFPLTVIVVSTALGFGWVVASLAATPASSEVRSGKIQNLSNSDRPSEGAVMAVVSGTIHVVWVETVYITPEICHIYKNSDSDWSDRACFEAGTHPALGVGADGTLDLVWLDNQQPGETFQASFIRYRRWDERLQMWLDSANVAVGSRGTLYSPAVAVGPHGTSHVVWVDTVSGSPRIRYRRRTGAGWEPAENVTRGSTPDIGVDAAGRPHVVWSDSSLFGETNDVYYLWKQTEDHWSFDHVLSDWPSSDSVDPHAAVDRGGTVHVTWREVVDGQSAILSRAGRESTWGTGSQQVVPLTERAETPAIVVDDGGFAYLAHAGADGIQLHVQDPDQRIWYAGPPIVSDQPSATSPRLASAERGVLHAVWTAPGVEGQTDIFYRMMGPGIENTPTVTWTPANTATATTSVTLTPPATSTAITSTPVASGTATVSPTVTDVPTATGTAEALPTTSPTSSATPSPSLTSTPFPRRKLYLPLIMRDQLRLEVEADVSVDRAYSGVDSRASQQSLAGFLPLSCTWSKIWLIRLIRPCIPVVSLTPATLSEWWQEHPVDV